MRHAFAVAVLAALALITAGSTTAAGGPPPKRSLVLTLDVIYQPTDRAGNPTGPAQTFHESPGPPSFVDELAAKGVGVSDTTDPDRVLAGRSRIADDGGTPSYSGCAAVQAIATAHDTIVRFDVVYRYHVKRNWCWNYGHRVTSASTTTPWFTDVDLNFYIVSVSISPHGYFYNWCCGDSRSGHYAFRQGQINNCVFKYGCIGSHYPTVELWLHGNGTWHSRPTSG